MNLAFRTALMSGTRIVTAFTPLSLFASGEVGAWYDPSDMSTMFQDAAGTTPVTAVEQPVSVILDKRIQQTFAPRLNRFDFSEQFDNSVWTKTSMTVTANSAVAPDGTTTVDTLTQSGTGEMTQPVTNSATSVTFSISVKAGNVDYIYLQVVNTVGGGNAVRQFYNVANGTVASAQTFGTGFTKTAATISAQANGFYRLSLTCTVPAANCAVALSPSSTDAPATRSSGQFLYIWGADIRSTSDVNTSPTYQQTTQWPTSWLGNHAYTPSTATASRPVLSARYNLLTKTEQFDDAIWTKGGLDTTGMANAATAPNGTLTADKFIETATTAQHRVFAEYIVPVTADFTASVYAKSNGRRWVYLYFGSNRWAYFDLQNGVTGTTASNTTAAITSVGNSWYRCSVTGNTTSGLQYFIINISDTDKGTIAPSYAGNGTDGLFIWGADLRVANDGVALPVYQRVNTSTDYDTTNFPMYLRFDGSDDYLLTSTITPGTDKAQVFAGVRKLSDTALGIVAELSATVSSNTGTFAFAAPNSTGASGDFLFYSRGSGATGSGASTGTILSPTTAVITGSGDISSPTQVIRRNGGNQVTNTAAQGTGNYLAYPLYIGRRGGTASPFNGRIYGMIVRFGANLDNTQITNTETWMNGKTKAY